MITKRPILLFFWFLISSLCIQAETMGDPFSKALPSEQTEQELQALSEDPLPKLRAKPTDIGDSEQAQKVPLLDCGFLEFSILGILLAFYAFVIRKNKKRLKKTAISFLLLFIIASGTINAQSIKAVADNYYLKPGGLYTLTITANDNPGDCVNNADDLVLTLLNTPSTTGVTWSKITGNKVRVLVPVTARGSDVIKYSIKCPSNPTTSTANVYLNFSERPDFVDDATCTVDPPETVWDIKKSLVSDSPIFFLANPLAGDLNGDGKPEIVVPGWKWLHKIPAGDPTDAVSTANSTTIMVFDNKLKLIREFGVLNTARTDTVGIDNYFGHPLALGDVDGDGQGEIIVGTGYYDNFKLRCYTMNGTLKWVSHNATGSEISCFAYPIVHKTAGSATPVIADIDGDGLVEIFAGDRFFDGKTGLLLATIPKGQVSVTTPHLTDLPTTYNWGRGHRQQGVHNTQRGFGTYQPVLADINGDGRLDAVCGNATYDIKINRANPDLSTTSLIAAVALPDGLTSVADINGDGVLDVVVVTRSPNGWDVLPSLAKPYVYPYSPTNKAIPTTMYAWGIHQCMSSN